MKSFFTLDRRKKMSLEEQVLHGIRNYVVSNKLLPESNLPTLEALSLMLKVESKLIEKSLDTLVVEGHLEKRDEDYVKVQKVINIFDSNHNYYSLTQLAKDLNLNSKIETLSKEWIDKPKEVQLDYSFKEGKFLRIHRINTFNDQHKALVIFNVHESLLSNASENDFKERSYYEVLKDQFKENYQSHRYESIVEAKGEVLQYLDLPKQSAILKSYQVVLDENSEMIVYLELYTAYEIFFTFQKFTYPKA